MTPFLDRRDAGKKLAAKILREHIGASANDSPRAGIVVLGIPRGGVIVANEIARALDAPLDVFITRKIGAPLNPELAIGAVADDGTVFLDHALIQELHIPQNLVAHERAAQLREIERRAKLYRRHRRPLDVENKIVILVDDGIATGATTIAALRALRHQEPAQIILAVPVAPRQILAQLRAECDELVLLDAPEPFVAVGYFYEDFEQVSDEEVVELLNET